MRDIIRQLLARLAARPASPIAGEAPAVAVDFETFYRSPAAAKRLRAPVCSVEEQGNWAYARQPEWEAYLVSCYAPAQPEHGWAEIAYAGPPEGAPWGELAGRTWLSHNRNFDRHAYERLVELGRVPAVAYREWHDTADLAAYCHLPRALAKVAALRWGLALDKAARAEMDGVRWADLAEPQRARLRQYAQEDAALAAAVWLDLAPEWPEEERRLSLHTGNIEFRGVPVDRARVEQHLGWLETALWRARASIPWVDEEDADTGRPYALRSKKALDRECLQRGVPPPETTAQTAKAFLDWLDAHGDRVPAARALARYRRIDRARATYRVLLSRIRPDGRAALGLKYLGAEKTGRWSGAGKFNLQNILKQPLAFARDTFAWLEWDARRGAHVDDAGAARAREDIHLVDTRSCLTASPGRKLIIPDLAQIEPRVLNWVAGNEAFLALCRAGISPYEAHARASMGWQPEAEKVKRWKIGKDETAADGASETEPLRWQQRREDTKAGAKGARDEATVPMAEAAGADGVRSDGIRSDERERVATTPAKAAGVSQRQPLPLKRADPALYALAKARVLALGYGAGWQTFIEMARAYLENEDVFLRIFAATPRAEETAEFVRYLQWSAERLGGAAAQAALGAWPDLDAPTRAIWVNAWLQVRDFRRTNPLIAGKGKPRGDGRILQETDRGKAESGARTWTGQRNGTGEAEPLSWQQRREGAKAGAKDEAANDLVAAVGGETLTAPRASEAEVRTSDFPLRTSVSRQSAIADRQSAEPEGLWARLERGFKASVGRGIYTLRLPSGRALKYFDVTPQWGWSCRPGNPLANPQRTYGGLLTENLCQAIGRDVFAAGLLRLEAAGYEVLFHVHDEAIIDAPADADPQECIRLLTTLPAWAATLPVDSEAEVAACYKK